MSQLKMVECTQNSLSGIEICNGTIYILTDSKREFMDINGNRIQIYDQTVNDIYLEKIEEMQELLNN